MSEGESSPVTPPGRSKAQKIFLIISAVVIAGVFAIQAWYHSKFPYGSSHCCILALSSALEIYAQDHGGRFPSGGDCPEASLSLLYSNYLDAYTLRGKTVPLQTVEDALIPRKSLGRNRVDGTTSKD
jgi:hypothetical protein